jgi:hypothetical protein
MYDKIISSSIGSGFGNDCSEREELLRQLQCKNQQQTVSMRRLEEKLGQSFLSDSSSTFEGVNLS